MCSVMNRSMTCAGQQLRNGLHLASMLRRVVSLIAGSANQDPIFTSNKLPGSFNAQLWRSFCKCCHTPKSSNWRLQPIHVCPKGQLWQMSAAATCTTAAHTITWHHNDLSSNIIQRVQTATSRGTLAASSIPWAMLRVTRPP